MANTNAPNTFTDFLKTKIGSRIVIGFFSIFTALGATITRLYNDVRKCPEETEKVTAQLREDLKEVKNELRHCQIREREKESINNKKASDELEKYKELYYETIRLRLQIEKKKFKK